MNWHYCLRDENGVFIIAKIDCFALKCELHISEAVGFLSDFNWVHELYLRPINFELDSKLVGDSFFSNWQGLVTLYTIVKLYFLLFELLIDKEMRLFTLSHVIFYVFFINLSYKMVGKKHVYLRILAHKIHDEHGVNIWMDFRTYHKLIYFIGIYYSNIGREYVCVFSSITPSRNIKKVVLPSSLFIWVIYKIIMIFRQPILNNFSDNLFVYLFIGQ